jgi:hypothetical protein
MSVSVLILSKIASNTGVIDFFITFLLTDGNIKYIKIKRWKNQSLTSANQNQRTSGES